MGNYACVLTAFTESNDQLINVQHVLEHAHAEYEELGNTFYVKTTSAVQERMIRDTLDTLPLKYVFAHVEYLNATYVAVNGIDLDKARRIRSIFYNGM